MKTEHVKLNFIRMESKKGFTLLARQLASLII